MYTSDGFGVRGEDYMYTPDGLGGGGGGLHVHT